MTELEQVAQTEMSELILTKILKKIATKINSKVLITIAEGFQVFIKRQYIRLREIGVYLTLLKRMRTLDQDLDMYYVVKLMTKGGEKRQYLLTKYMRGVSNFKYIIDSSKYIFKEYCETMVRDYIKIQAFLSPIFKKLGNNKLGKLLTSVFNAIYPSSKIVFKKFLELIRFGGNSITEILKKLFNVKAIEQLTAKQITEMGRLQEFWYTILTKTNHEDLTEQFWKTYELEKQAQVEQLLHLQKKKEELVVRAVKENNVDATELSYIPSEVINQLKKEVAANTELQKNFIEKETRELRNRMEKMEAMKELKESRDLIGKELVDDMKIEDVLDFKSTLKITLDKQNINQMMKIFEETKEKQILKFLTKFADISKGKSGAARTAIYLSNNVKKF
eukprot:Pgem_evm1s17420